MLPLLRPISANISNDESDDAHTVGTAEAGGMADASPEDAAVAAENTEAPNAAVLRDSESDTSKAVPVAVAEADGDADKGEPADSPPLPAASGVTGRNAAGASNGFLAGEFSTDDEAEDAPEPMPEMCGDEGTDWLILPVLPSDSDFFSSDFKSDFDELFRPNMPRRDFLRPPRNPGRSELLGLSLEALDASAEVGRDDDDDESAAVSIEKDSTASCDDGCGMARYSSPGSSRTALLIATAAEVARASALATNVRLSDGASANAPPARSSAASSAADKL